MERRESKQVDGGEAAEFLYLPTSNVCFAPARLVGHDITFGGLVPPITVLSSYLTLYKSQVSALASHVLNLVCLFGYLVACTLTEVCGSKVPKVLNDEGPVVPFAGGNVLQ